MIKSQNHTTSYLWPRGRTDTHTQTHTHIPAMKVPDYKKLDARRPAVSGLTMTMGDIFEFFVKFENRKLVGYMKISTIYM